MIILPFVLCSWRSPILLPPVSCSAAESNLVKPGKLKLRGGRRYSPPPQKKVAAAPKRSRDRKTAMMTFRLPPGTALFSRRLPRWLRGGGSALMGETRSSYCLSELKPSKQNWDRIDWKKQEKRRAVQELRSSQANLLGGTACPVSVSKDCVYLFI